MRKTQKQGRTKLIKCLVCASLWIFGHDHNSVSPLIPSAIAQEHEGGEGHEGSDGHEGGKEGGVKEGGNEGGAKEGGGKEGGNEGGNEGGAKEGGNEGGAKEGGNGGGGKEDGNGGGGKEDGNGGGAKEDGNGGGAKEDGNGGGVKEDGDAGGVKEDGNGVAVKEDTNASGVKEGANVGQESTGGSGQKATSEAGGGPAERPLKPGEISSDGKKANIDGHVGDAPEGAHFEHENGKTIIVFERTPEQHGESLPNVQESKAATAPDVTEHQPPNPTANVGGSIREPHDHLGNSRNSDPNSKQNSSVITPRSIDSSQREKMSSSSTAGNSADAPSNSAAPSDSQIPQAKDLHAHVSSQVTSLAAAYELVKKQAGNYCGNNGQCATLVKSLTDVPSHTPEWKRGPLVRGNTAIAIGTAISTFNFYGKPETNGYGPSNHRTGKSGESHSGIYLGQTEKGLLILHQWEKSVGPKVGFIPWGKWNGHPKEGGQYYYIIH